MEQQRKRSDAPPKSAPIAVIDFETDPFRHGREPHPFAAGFYSDETGLVLLWGDDCASQLRAVIKGLSRPHVIYAHNGGRFDFFFIYPWLENPLLIINARIVEARMMGHWLRDSFAILPVPLRDFGSKRKIDYGLMERAVREKNRKEILLYLGQDCRGLFEAVTAFVSQFGFRITIGTTAMTALQAEHPQRFIRDPIKAEEHDDKFRVFYYGGRVEAFQGGVVKGDWKVYDVNSMYPGVMRNYLHPAGSNYVKVANPRFNRDGTLQRFAADAVYFVDFVGRASHLPAKDKTGALHFGNRVGRFTVTSHEFKVAYSAGLVEVYSINDVWVALGTQSFAEFVDKFTIMKIDAEKRGDKKARLFAKLLMNSAYGKFATNPRKFKEWHIETLGEWNTPDDPVSWTVETNTGEYRLWSRAVPTESGWKDVAIAASITGASRAELLKAILKGKRVAYCDTDSIICEALPGVKLHATELGAWKTEAKGDTLATGGKKLYALFDKGRPVKWASKGAVLTPAEIKRVANGGSIDYVRDAPSYSVTGSAKFLTRTIRSTLDGPNKKRR